jgi:AbrB family looped-hinge helix DNA binding protein
MKPMHTKVSKRGQVSIPSDVRKQLQIGPDTRLEWIIEGAAVRVFPLPANTIKAFRGSGKRGLVHQLLQDRKKDRKRENES